MEITEELKELLGNPELSEDTLTKLKVMIEKAVHEKSGAIIEELQEELKLVKEKAQEYGDHIKEELEAELELVKEKAQEYGDYITEELSSKMENYADYVVEKFIEENKSQLVESVEYNRMKSAFDEVKGVFESKSFALAEPDPESVSEELNSQLAEAKSAYNTLFDEHATLKATVDKIEKERLFESLTGSLAQTQKEKVSKIINTMSFNGFDEYKRAIEIMIEEVVQPVQDKKTPDVEDTKPVTNTLMEQYLNRL